MGKKGRPKGWKMPASVKKKISNTRTGQKHTAETKDNIAIGVSEFWANEPDTRIVKRHFCVLTSFVKRAKNITHTNAQTVAKRDILNRIRVLLTDYPDHLTNTRLLFLHGRVMPALDIASTRIEWRHVETAAEIHAYETVIMHMLGYE